MDPFELFRGLTIDDVLMVVLTAITVVLTAVIALSVRLQAKYTRQLAEISIQSERGTRERHEPKVRLSLRSHGVLSGDTQKLFVGFSITSASAFDVTITSIALGLGFPADEINGPFTPAISLPHIDQYRGYILSDCSLPRRLQYGESMCVYYDEEAMIGAMKSHGKDEPARFLPQCHDSLGNLHTMGYWIGLDKNSKVAFFFPDPGAGLVSEQQFFNPPLTKKGNTIFTRLFWRAQRPV